MNLFHHGRGDYAIEDDKDVITERLVATSAMAGQLLSRTVWSMDDGERDWREQRERAVRAHAAADEQRRAAEEAEAARIVAWFAAEANRRSLRRTRLAVQPYDGGGRYRSRLTGWYVDRALTRAVDARGNFYLLSVPPSLRARLLGADPRPQPAPLVVGQGGRDGESIPLRALLTRRLDAGDDWP